MLLVAYLHLSKPARQLQSTSTPEAIEVNFIRVSIANTDKLIHPANSRADANVPAGGNRTVTVTNSKSVDDQRGNREVATSVNSAAGIAPEGPQAPLMLEIEADENITFDQDPLRRSSRSTDVGRPGGSRFRMADNSLMGRYQQRLRSLDCAELRRAMQRDANSTETILATMSKRGCKM